MKKVLLIAILAFMFVGCTSSSDAQRALDAQGFTDVTYTGYDFLACSKDDVFHTGFRAKNAQGIYVEGTACSGLLFKNTTLRF